MRLGSGLLGLRTWRDRVQIPESEGRWGSWMRGFHLVPRGAQEGRSPWCDPPSRGLIRALGVWGELGSHVGLGLCPPLVWGVAESESVE